MAFFNTVTLEDGVSEKEIKRRHPASYPKPFVPPAPYVPVLETPQPTHNRMTQVVRKILPVESNGQWFQAWEVIESAEARKAAGMESLRINNQVKAQRKLVRLKKQLRKDLEAEDAVAAIKTQQLITEHEKHIGA